MTWIIPLPHQESPLRWHYSTPQKLTNVLKFGTILKRKWIIFEPSVFRGYVSFQGAYMFRLRDSYKPSFETSILGRDANPNHEPQHPLQSPLHPLHRPSAWICSWIEAFDDFLGRFLVTKTLKPMPFRHFKSKPWKNELGWDSKCQVVFRSIFQNEIKSSSSKPQKTWNNFVSEFRLKKQVEILPPFCEDLFIIYLQIPIPSSPKKIETIQQQKIFLLMNKNDLTTQSNLVWRHIKHLWSIKWVTTKNIVANPFPRKLGKASKRDSNFYVSLSFWKSLKKNSWISCQYEIDQPSKLSGGHSAMRLGIEFFKQFPHLHFSIFTCAEKGRLEVGRDLVVENMNAWEWSDEVITQSLHIWKSCLACGRGKHGIMYESNGFRFFPKGWRS